MPHDGSKAGGQVAGKGRAPTQALKTVRPKLFRRASLTSWGKDNMGMTRAAASVNLKELMLTVQQQKYEDRDKAAQREMSHTASYEGEESIRHRNERRARLLSRSGEKRDFLVNWEREGRANWNANQAVLCRYERRLLNYELAVRATAIARKRLSSDRHTNDETEGIQWFEKNLDKLGLDPGSETGGGATLLPDKETRATFRSRIRRAVVDQQFVPGSNAEAMAELRFRGSAGRRGRQEREHRRVKTEVDQRRAKMETDDQRASGKHLRSLLETGREQRDAAAASWEREYTLAAKALFQKEKFAKMTMAEQEAFEAAFSIRAADARERYAMGGADREAKAHALQESHQNHREEKRRQTEIVCSQIAHKMADLAVVSSEARAHQGGVPLPPTIWTRLKRRFCSSEPFFPEPAAPQRPSEPLDPVLKTRALIENRNLNRCKGCWRPRGLALAELPPQRPPLSDALSVARDLVEATGSGPREAQRYGRRPVDANGGDNGDRELSIKLVMLGDRNGLFARCVELGRWTRLYVCSLETALECAMEVGAEMAASDGKGGNSQKAGTTGKKNSTSDRKGSKSSGKNSVSGGKDSLVGVVNGESGAANKDAVVAEITAGEGKGAAARRAFDPSASEEDVAAFRAAAAAYHALRTHPKKAAAPVPVATTTELLVKHLACRAPRGRGWVLVGYPRTLLESKIFENALSGYTDDDVMTELGGGGKPTKNKGNAVAEQQEPPPPPRPGVDAIVNLVRICPDQTRPACPTDNQTSEKGESAEVASPPEGFGDKVSGKMAETVGGIGENTGGIDDEEDYIDSDERNARSAWWESFEGGHLACDVPQEANDERLLETLFLVVNAVQNRKDAHDVWLKRETPHGQISTEVVIQKFRGDDADDDVEAERNTTNADNSESALTQPSPLTVSVTDPLEDLRSERRASMSHATRIRVEALTGERGLDLESVRSTITHIETREGGDSGDLSTVDEHASPPQVTEALRKLENVCSASSVVDWAATTEFSFARGVRRPDDRWIAVCLRLESEIVSWLRQRDDGDARPNGNRGGEAVGDGGTGSALGLDAPQDDEGCVWEALEAFELEAGDIVDDRHASTDATVANMDAEADRRMRDWAENAAQAAADLCAAERTSYLDTVEALRVLHGQFGLRRDCSTSLESIESIVRASADALTEEFAAVSERQHFGNGGRVLESEVRRATEEVSSDYRQPKMDQTTSDVSHLDLTCNQGQHTTGQESMCETQGYAEDGASSQPLLSGEVTLNTLHSVDAGVSDDLNEEKDEPLATAVWLSRQIHLCRLRGVVVRLATATRQCEDKISSMRAASRRMKRRRVQLEHKCVSGATSAVRHALEHGDNVAISDILQCGIPLWVKDDETFAADPYVALPWGMRGLDLSHIASLASTLKNSLGVGAEQKGTTGATTNETMVPVAELVHKLRTWSDSVATDASGEVTRTEAPAAGFRENRGYVETLCRSIGAGANANEVPWRRLIHCLLLGHVPSLPSLGDLCSMREAFRTKPSSASRLSTGVPARPSSATAGAKAAKGHDAQELSNLRFAQRYLPSVRFWFEKEKETKEEGEHRKGGGSGGSKGSSAIKAVYSEAWVGDDGRLDGLDLLLTLCAVPADSSSPVAVPVVDDKEEGRGNDGIPFSVGLFRAFTVLAEKSCSATPHATHPQDREVVSDPIATAAAAADPSPIAEEPPARTTSNSSAVCRERHASFDGYCENPRVTLPHLKAILEHGVGMSVADVSSVCEAVSTAEEDRRRRQRDLRLLQPITPPGTPEGLVEKAGLEGGIEVTTCVKDVSAEATDIIKQVVSGGTPGDNAKTVRAAESQHGQKGDEGGLAQECAIKSTTEEGQQKELPGMADSYTRNPSHEESMLTVSFAAVCDCEAVRAWVRQGAYTLPSFDVTSGRQPQQ